MPPPSLDTPRGGSPPPLSKPKEKLLSLFLKAIIMMFLISFFFLLVPLASFFLLLSLLFRHQHHRHRPRPLHSSGLSSEQLKKLPRFRFSQKPKPIRLEPDSCVICLDGFRQGQWCRNLVGCGHLFHSKCLDSWLIRAASCPICRTRVSLDGEDEDIWGFDKRRTELTFRVC